MAIYVDQLAAHTTLKGVTQWCHMASDESTDELVNFADRIGLKPNWLQTESSVIHYDLTPNKRKLALEAGAIELNTKELLARCKRPGEIIMSTTDFEQEEVSLGKKREELEQKEVELEEQAAPKKFYQSRTNIVNALMMAGAGTAFVLGPNFPIVLTPEVLKAAMVVMAVVNIGLRFVTGKPVTLPTFGSSVLTGYKED